MAGPFNPFGSDYDIWGALDAGLGPDESGHWPSRDPVSGRILKGMKHPTWPLTVEGERAAGYEIVPGEDARLYSQPLSLAGSPAERAAQTTRRSVKGIRPEGVTTKVTDAIGQIPMSMVGAAARMVDQSKMIADDLFPLQHSLAPQQAGRFGSLQPMMDAMPREKILSSDEDVRKGSGELVAENALNVMGLPGIMSGSPMSLASGMIRRTRDLPMDRDAVLARAKEQGWDLPWYHGGLRMDRFTEKGKVDARRATSGPMPYFTDDPAMASAYAQGKKPDTSLYDAGHVPDYFTVHPKYLGYTGSRTPYTVEQSWHHLPAEVKADILDLAKRVGHANPSMGEGPYTLHPPGSRGVTLSDDHYDHILRTEARGNPLHALREMWHDSGSLVGNESELSQIFKLAGYPHPISEATAPWTEARGVFPAALRLRNPLVTSNDEMVGKAIPALEDAFKRDRSRLAPYGADMWAKDSRYTPRDWVAQLREDFNKGGAASNTDSYVWTSIPDKVTGQLQRLGYDSVLDMGGKMGGDKHRVAIPFRPDQVRSIFGRFDPANEGKPFLLGANPTDRKTGAAVVAANSDFGSLSPKLPMDEASRMQRAADQGFTREAYHSTNTDFDRFKRKANDLGMHFGTPGQAADRLQYLRDVGARELEGSRTIPTNLKLKNPLRLDDLGFWGSDNVQWALKDNPKFSPDEVQRALRSARNESGKVAALRDLIESKGYDGVVYRNTGEVQGGHELHRVEREKFKEMQAALGLKPGRTWGVTPEQQKHPAYVAYSEAEKANKAFREKNAEDSFIAFRPQQVRSRFAAFDPANKDSGFLLGANAGDRKTGVATVAANADFGSLAPQATGIRAYHGSPHDFDRFDLSKYVVFDDSLVSILRKYALPGAVGAGGLGSLAPVGDQ